MTVNKSYTTRNRREITRSNKWKNNYIFQDVTKCVKGKQNFHITDCELNFVLTILHLWHPITSNFRRLFYCVDLEKVYYVIVNKFLFIYLRVNKSF